MPIITQQEYEAHYGIGTEGRSGLNDPNGYTLTLRPNRTTDLVTTGMKEALAAIKGSRWTDILIRKDGQWVRFEADWLRYVELSILDPAGGANPAPPSSGNVK